MSRAAALVAAALGLFLVSWSLLHHGTFARGQITDTGPVRDVRRRDGARAGSVPRLPARIPAGRAAGVRSAVARPRGRPRRLRPLVRPSDGALRLHRDRRRGTRAARARRRRRRARRQRSVSSRSRRCSWARWCCRASTSGRRLSRCSRSPHFCTSGSCSRRSRLGAAIAAKLWPASARRRSSSCTSGAHAARAQPPRGWQASCSSTLRSSFRSPCCRRPACVRASTRRSPGRCSSRASAALVLDRAAPSSPARACTS